MIIKSSTLINILKLKFQQYWTLIKSLQTGLLLVTGFTGYISPRCPVMTWETLVGLIGSLFFTISGSTVLNMVYDRDIDAKMNRTSHRPLPSGRVGSTEALVLGFAMSLFGLIWAYLLSPLYAAVVFSGLFIDVIIYTVWLKRKTAFSIIWGGISGGMPILAGRVLGIGQIDSIGILLAISILLWIPTHILTFNMRHFDDYNRAGIPTFPLIYGYKNTRLIIALSCIGAAIAIGLGSYTLGLAWGYLRLLAVLTVGFMGLAIYSIKRPSEKVNFALFKYASLFMLGSMWMMVLGALK